MARLKEIYGSLFSGQSLGLTPSEVASVLLEKVGMDGASHLTGHRNVWHQLASFPGRTRHFSLQKCIHGALVCKISST